MDKVIKLVLAVAILSLAACADQQYVYQPGQPGDNNAAAAKSTGEYYSIPSVVNDSMEKTEPSVQPPKVD